MPSCVVKWCKINSSTQHKTDGITFHRFPIDVYWKCRWIEVIRECRNESKWNPSNSSVVCSLHFENSDLYTTKGGLRRVVKNAIPTKDLNYSNNGGSQSADMSIEPSLQPELFEPNIVLTEAPKIADSLNSDANLQRSSLDPLIKAEPGEVDRTANVISHRELFDQANNEGAISSTSIISTGISGVWIGPPKVGCQRPANMVVNVFRYEDPSEDPEPKINKKLISKPTKSLSGFQKSSIETFRERQLKEKLKEKQAVIEASKKKIKTLHQNVRRLTKRNKLLKHMLRTLKKQTDLYTKLNGIDTDACLDME